MWAPRSAGRDVGVTKSLSAVTFFSIFRLVFKTGDGAQINAIASGFAAARPTYRESNFDLNFFTFSEIAGRNRLRR